MKILDRSFDAAGNHHCSRMPANLIECNYLIVKVIDHNFSLHPNGMVAALDVSPQLLLGSSNVEFWIAFDLLNEFVVALDRRVVTKHIQYETLLNCLFQRCAVKWAVLDLPANLK